MKTLKRVLSMAMALVLLVGGLAVLPTEAKGAEFTAALNFADRNWGYSTWTDTPVEGATTTVNGSGTYTVTLDATKAGADGTTPCSGVQVFCFDIVGAITGGVSYEIESLKVLADGKEVAVDMTKVKTGDLEEKGNYRIEIYNEYGSTKDDSPIGDPTAFSFASTLTVEVTLKEVAAPTEGGSDLDQEFTAALNFADRNWGYSAWTDTPVDGSTTTVKGSGTYTVTLDATKTGADGTTPCSGAQVFCFDIVGAVSAGVSYEIESLKVLADGKEVAVDLTKVKTGDLEEKGNYRIEIYNEYGSTKDDSPIGDPTAFSFASTLTVEVTLKAVAAPVNVDLNQEFTAALNFADRNWGYSTWTDTPVEGATTTVKGDGTYTVTLDATKAGADGTTPCSGVQVFCFDVIGAEAAGVTYKVEALKILADGKEVAVDLSKVL
ncbi:MAG: hypothetical protein ACI4TK_12045, partial [Agathobacter sp.]